MIRADDRVATVLARNETLLDIFVEASPAFEKLKVPAMRKTMARLVTVAQAARIAGIDAAELLRRLNEACGESSSPDPLPAMEATATPSAELLATPEERIFDLDVRDDLRAGKEPLRRILDAARALPNDCVLRLRAIFEPAPLYGVLGRQGFSHATERFAADDWRVWFYRDASAAAATAKAPAAEAAHVEEEDVVVLDVRELEPPEPMVRTLEALQALPRGKTLVQLNQRIPQFLLPKLQERGFAWEVREQSPSLVRIFIRHKE